MTSSNPAIILVKPRFPENIGMTARACANMGCQHLILVAPELWLPHKAEALATAQGLPVLANMRICADLPAALAPFHLSIAATARTGGFRRAIMRPEQMARTVAGATASGLDAALVLGPEDRGLTNVEIGLCTSIVHIQTAQGASSLNLAQAALLLLYECRKACACSGTTHAAAQIDHADQRRLEETLMDTLLRMDCLPRQNPHYFFRQWQQILRRAGLRRHEYDCLMGFCRQLGNKLADDAK